jgi:hypothetical protein
MICRERSGTCKQNTSSNSAHYGRSAGTHPLSGFFVPAVLLLVSAGASGTPARDPVPAEPSLVEITQGLAARRFAVRTLERHYTTRIEAIDQAGAKLNSIIEINPDAAKVAAALDAGNNHGQPLFGVPILLKDNIDTSDNLHTTAGSLALMVCPWGCRSSGQPGANRSSSATRTLSSR